MIIFHEGLPRSGKSYETVVKHIIPALANGRPVDAYVEGLNHAKIAELAGITEERCRELLVQIEREQVPMIWECSRDNALVVIDELQNFWPSSKTKLGPQITQFITEHGHRGQDIIAMGQDYRDCHALWRRRVAQKAMYVKLDGVGAENRYSVTLYKASEPEKFEKVTKTVSAYDPKYFGTYKSHTGEGINTANYKDSRAVVWNSWQFKVGIPAFAVAVVAACWYVYGIFWGGELIAPPPPPAVMKPIVQASYSQPAQTTQPQPQAQAVPPPPADYVQEISAKWRPRLAAYMEMGTRKQGVIDWYDGAMRRQESMDFRQLEAQGYRVRYVAGIVYLEKNLQEMQVTAWPMEPFGKLSNAQTQAVSDPY